jgi:hypothetical protein
LLSRVDSSPDKHIEAAMIYNLYSFECIIGPGSQVEYPTGTENRNFVEDQPRNIPCKFGSNWPSGFGEEA